jgi:putative mRNA 3-end processing factor
MVRHNQKTIALDPSSPSDCDITFVSHAHVDHLHRRSRGGKKKPGNAKQLLLASHETIQIARARGYDISEAKDSYDKNCNGEGDDIELVETGHILGSRGFLFKGDSLYYTGDISTRNRAFMKAAKIPHAKTLIIESTFGRPGYVFPPLSEITHKTNAIISEMYDLAKPVLLMGYALGKAQLLTELFNHWDPVYVHDSVANMNSVYSKLGIGLKNATTYSEAEERGLLKNGPWIMVAPLMSARSTFVRQLRERFGAITIGFSGWATDPSYKYMMGLDYAMPMSDHCDYNELVVAVKECNPEQIYTFHGFARDFARSLCKMGYDAGPVGEHAHRGFKSENNNSNSSLSLDSFQ